MRFVKKSNLQKDLRDVPSAVEKGVLGWLKVVTAKETVWKTFMDVRNYHADASKVEALYVFNMTLGYRLIVGINFNRQAIYYKAILSHKEYDKGHWKTKFSRHN